LVYVVFLWKNVAFFLITKLLYSKLEVDHISLKIVNSHQGWLRMTLHRKLIKLVLVSTEKAARQ